MSNQKQQFNSVLNAKSLCWLAYACSLLSGCSALVYEIAWTRILATVFGSTIWSISSVVAVFMGGLAIGNSLFGRWIDRTKRPLRTYALIEFGIAVYATVFALATPGIHQLMTSVQLIVGEDFSLPVRIVLAAVILLPPTVLMGGTLPILSRCFFVADQVRATQRITAMYGLNTIGAVVGCLLAAFVFIPGWGVTSAIMVAAAINGVIAFAAFANRNSVVVRLAADSSEHQSAETSGTLVDEKLCLLMGFVAGFVSLSAQLVWTRQLINQLSGNVLIFSIILAAFLTGMGLAGLIVSRCFRSCRTNQDAKDGGSRASLSAENGLTTLLLLNAIWLIAGIFAENSIANLFNGIHRSVSAPTNTTLICLLTLFGLLLPATTTLGCLCPWLLAMVTDRSHESSSNRIGELVGRLLSVNTLGAIAGSLLTGFLFIHSPILWLCVLAIVCSICALVVSVVSRTWMNSCVAVAAIYVCVLTINKNEAGPLWFNAGFTRVIAIPAADVRYRSEGTEGTIAVIANDEALRLLVNGVVVADSSKEDMWDLLLKAHLPMLIHPQPKQIAVVGLGAGISLGAIEAYDCVESIDCVELCPEVVDAHQYFGSFNDRCWKDPRLTMHINDGRHFLLTTSTTYDVINVDPVDPPVCNQYTQEFVQVCHDRLNDGGLMVQWIPLFHLKADHLKSMAASFVNVFPNSTMWYDGTSILLIGCKTRPLTIDLERAIEQGRTLPVVENLSVIGRPDPLILLGMWVCDSNTLKKWIGDAKPNTDDHPWLEYELLLAGPLRQDSFLENLREIRSLFHAPHEEFISGSSSMKLAATKTRTALRQLTSARIERLQGEHAAADSIIESTSDKFGLSENALKVLGPLLSE